VLRGILSAIFIFLGTILRKLNLYFREAIRPLECGFITIKDSRQPISLRFFVFAVIFVIFDIELILVIPFLKSQLQFLERFIFFFFIIVFLTLGLFLEWKNKAFE